MERYRIIKRLGQGSFGQVVLAQRKSTGEFFAIKKVSNVNGKEALVEKEIEALRKIRHPNILRVYQYFYEQEEESTNCCLCIVLEYCRDGDLFNHIVASGNRELSSLEGRAIGIMKQVVNGCIAMNRKGIIHRDLKPENILLVGDVVKMADFGSAKLVPTRKGVKLSFNVGTPIYMAPEMMNEERYDEKCDVWSVGVVLYFLLYGQIPFFEKTLLGIKTKIKEQTGATGIVLPNFPQFSEELKDLLRGMLRYDQQQRLTWGEITNSRVFQPLIEDIESYVKYLLEVVKVVTWMTQSLWSSAVLEIYSHNSVANIIQLANRYVASLMNQATSIVYNSKLDPSKFKQQGICSWQAPGQLIELVQSVRTKTSQYQARMHQKLPKKNQKNMIISQNRTGRYYLWECQKICRKLITDTSNQGRIDSDSTCLRTLYCLIILEQHDKFLGEQHYLQLSANDICKMIKEIPVDKLRAKIEIQVTSHY